MRRFATCLLIGVVFMLSACITSLHPFYTEEDVMFDPTLLGTWISIREKETWEFSSRDPSSRSYELTHTDARGNKAMFVVHLFQLENQTFFDLVAISETRNELHSMHTPPSHFVMLVETMEPTLRIALLGQGIFDNKSKHYAELPAYTKIDKSTWVFTAPTEHLRRWLAKLATTERTAAFPKLVELVPKDVIE